MTLGKCNFTDVIYVALIDSDVLLGVDLLNKHKAKIDLLNFNLCLQSFDIPMVLESKRRIQTFRYLLRIQ